MTAARRLTLGLGAAQLVTWATTFYLPAVFAAPAGASLSAAPAAVLGAFSGSLLLAGLCAPRIGRHIERHGGRGVLATGAGATAAGLLLLAAAPGLPAWYGGWAVLGLGMACGLYDAAFATVGRLLGDAAPPVITGITLMAGFASTVGWPAGAALVAAIGWRATLAAYAALQLGLVLPLVLAVVPAAAAPTPATAAPARHAGGPALRADRTLACLAGFFTLRWLITSALAVSILPLLRGLGLTPGWAVLVAAMIGPGQVAGRVLEWSLAGRLGVLTRARLGAALFPGGVALLAAAGPAAAPAFALLYGMSNGILTINRGTLPLALFGPAGYAARLGWLAMPVLLAQATAPTLAAPLTAALSSSSVLLLAGALAGAGGLLLLPLRLPDRS